MKHLSNEFKAKQPEQTNSDGVAVVVMNVQVMEEALAGKNKLFPKNTKFRHLRINDIS